MENNDIVAASTSASFTKIQYATSRDFITVQKLCGHAALKDNSQYYLRFFKPEELKSYWSMSNTEKDEFKKNYRLKSVNDEILQLIFEHAHEQAKIVFFEDINNNIKIAIECGSNNKDKSKEIFNQNGKYIELLVKDNDKRWSDIESHQKNQELSFLGSVYSSVSMKNKEFSQQTNEINTKKQDGKAVSQNFTNSANSDKSSTNLCESMLVSAQDSFGDGGLVINSSYPEKFLITQKSLTEAEGQTIIGPLSINGWQLQDVDSEGNCFYDAVIHQMESIKHSFLDAVQEGTLARDSLRLRIQGQNFQDNEWADTNEILALARGLNLTVAIVDTRHPELGFRCYHPDSSGQTGVQDTNDYNLVPTNIPVIRLAYTGNHYLSVTFHPDLANGALRQSFQIVGLNNVNPGEKIKKDLGMDVKIVSSLSNSAGSNQKQNSNIVNATATNNNNMFLNDKSILSNLEKYKEKNKNNPAICRAMENVVMRTLGYKDIALTTSGVENHQPNWKMAQNRELLDKKIVINELTTKMLADNRYLHNIPEERKETLYTDFLNIVGSNKYNIVKTLPGNIDEILNAPENNVDGKYLNLGGCGIVDADIEQIVNMLNDNPNIIGLNLNKSFRHLHFRNVQSFAEDVSENSFIANMMVLQKALSEKGIKENYLSANGAAKLSKLLHVQYLDLSDNDLGEEGVKALATMPNLKKLWVLQCNIPAQAAKHFLKFEKLEFLHDAHNESNNNLEEELEVHFKNNKIKNADATTQLILLQAAEMANVENKIMQAIEEQDVLQLTPLIPRLRDGINTEMEYGCTPLMYAVDKNLPDMVDFLITHGARLEDHTREYTPLFTAVENGQLEMVELFLKYGANLTGEFYFNQEDCLSIAAFKFCERFIDFLENIDYEDAFESLKNVGQDEFDCMIGSINKLIDDWRSRFEQGPPLWIAFSENEDLRQKYTKFCLDIFKFFNLKKIYERLDQEQLDEINKLNRLAKIYELIDEKINVLNEKPGLQNLDPESGDDDSEVLSYRINRMQTNKHSINILSKEELEKHVKVLNKELEHTTEDKIEWDKYPKFYIAQYRGLHYYRNLFSRTQRLDHCNTWHLNRISAAPAVYHMSSLTPGQHQLARESVIDSNKERVVNVFDKLESSGSTTQYWGDKNRTFENASDMLQERMSNAYDGYKKDVQNPTKSYTQLLYNNKIIGYPHYATSDLPFHALKYAYGQKAIESLKEWRLLPMFRENGGRLYPHPGKIFISMYTPLEMHKYRTRHVAGKHKRKQIKLSRYVLPERETSIPGGIEAGAPFYEELLRIPSFEAYIPHFCEEHGIDFKKFEKFKKAIASVWSINDEKEKNDAIEKMNTDLIEKTLIPHKEEQLLEIAQNEAKQRGGYLIYRHFDGKYGLQPEGLPLPGKENNAVLYKREEELLSRVEEQRFDRKEVLSSTEHSQKCDVKSYNKALNNLALQQTPLDKNPKKRHRDEDENSDLSVGSAVEKKSASSSFFSEMLDDENELYNSCLMPKISLLDEDSILEGAFSSCHNKSASTVLFYPNMTGHYGNSIFYDDPLAFKPRKFVEKDEQYYEGNVAADGSCLFYSVAFAYLFPVAHDVELFRQRFVILFGEEVAGAAEENRQYFIQNGGREIIQNPEVLQILVNHNFRQRVVNYICKRADKFQQFIPENESFAERMQKMENPSRKEWGDQPEIAAISQMLKVNVSVYQMEGEVLTPILGAEHKVEDSNIEICLLYTQASAASITTNPNNHYNYLLKEQDLPANKTKLQQNAVTEAVWQSEIQENASEFRIHLEHPNIASGSKRIKIEETGITKESYCIEPETQSQTNIKPEGAKTSDYSSLSNSANQETIASSFAPINFPGVVQIAENATSLLQSNDAHTGAAININQTGGPSISGSGIHYSFSSGCKNLTWAAQRATTLVTKPLFYAYKNSGKIKQGLYQLANAAGREGAINCLRTAARVSRCSLDGTSRV